MPTVPKPTTSLRRKITLGYMAIGVLILGLSLAAYMELRQLEKRLAIGSRIENFLNVILELRRYEKNYFLYRKESDLEAYQHWMQTARELPEHHIQEFALFMSPGIDLRRYIQIYGEAMDAYVNSRLTQPNEMAKVEEMVRQAGKRVATLAEEMAILEKERLFATLAGHRRILAGVIVILFCLVLAAGHILARMVTRPLKNMEQAMRQVAEENPEHIDMTSNDQEISSLTHAVNRMLQDLRVRQRQLVRSEKLASLGTMLSGVAHELNNPLSNVATSCQILLEEPDLPDLHRDMLRQIDEQTLRAQHIVRSLLDFARERPFQRESVMVAGLVEDTLGLLRAQMTTDIQVERHMSADLTVHTDRQRLQQALLNLIKNGIDALQGRGKIVIQARLLSQAPPLTGNDPLRLVAGHVQKCRSGKVVEILVQDTGPGIEPSVLPRILDPFFTTKEVGQGSGLGLFVTYEIIEEHGGCLVVDTRPGIGTEFRLLLPQETAPVIGNVP
ncbi:MAG: HAMP domain-containing protein [Magnetococcales bacterium]|nr:HAMP domain-containing protein [Magnetococcales bacterium]